MTKMHISLASLICAVALVSGCGGAPEENESPALVDAESSVEATTGSSDNQEPDPTSGDENAAEVESPEGGAEASFADGVLITPEVKIVITEHKLIPVGDEGNEYGDKPVIAFWYEITNLTDDDVSPLNWIYYFTAYQDNNPNAENELNISSLPDDRFLDSQTETIKEGGTVENAMAYELDDETTPVDLVAHDFTTEFGRTTYNLG